MITVAVAAAVPAEFSLTALAIGVVLLVVNGWFTATEIALLAARSGRIDEAAQAGDRRAAWASKALRDLRTSFSATQIGVTMSSLGLGVVAEPALAALLLRWLAPLGIADTVIRPVAVGIALALVVFLHMVVGDMAPKNLAIAKAERVVLAVARPFGMFVAVCKPLIVVLNAASLAVLRALRVTPAQSHQLVHTADELRLVVTDAGQQGTLGSDDTQMLSAALRLETLTAQAAMTPRSDVVAVPADTTMPDVEATCRDHGVTRLVIYDDGIDDVVGMLNVKDLIISSEEDGASHAVAHTARDLLRPLMAIPGSRRLDQLLHDMRADGQHAALVIDEHGATAGLITLEDILEELVGDIVDEFDDEGEAVVSDRRWVVDGTLRRDELDRLTGLVLEGDNATVSGWMVEQLGRLPVRGDRHVIDGWRLTVLSVEGRRAGRIEIVAPRRRPSPVVGDDG